MGRQIERPHLWDRGAWQATVHGVARAGYDLVTKPRPACEAGGLGD